MKRIVTVFLLFFLLWTVSGCQQEELPPPEDYEVVRNALLDNSERAKSQYTGIEIEWNIPVHHIEKEFSGGAVTDLYVAVRAPQRTSESNAAEFHFYLSQEEMKSLELESVIRVKGKIDKILLDDRIPLVEVQDASIVTDVLRVSGEILDLFEAKDGTPYCHFVDNNVIPIGAIITVFLPEDHGLSVGDTITLDTKLPQNDFKREIELGVQYGNTPIDPGKMTFGLFDGYTIVK